MRTFLISVILISFLAHTVSASQIVAGSPEDKMFQLISAETNSEIKLQRLADYEKQFPQSKALANVYLIAIELYREKGDRDRVNEYGEKVLKLDERNVTAMMTLSRNYAIQRKNLDRAVELAQRAVEVIGKMKGEPTPVSSTDSKWKEYLQATEAAAQGILDYTKAIKGREPESAPVTSSVVAPTPVQQSEADTSKR